LRFARLERSLFKGHPSSRQSGSPVGTGSIPKAYSHRSIDRFDCGGSPSIGTGGTNSTGGNSCHWNNSSSQLVVEDSIGNSIGFHSLDLLPKRSIPSSKPSSVLESFAYHGINIKHTSLTKDPQVSSIPLDLPLEYWN